MVATANAGQEFLSRTWGEEKLNKVNAMLDERDNVDGTSDSRATNHASSSTATTSGSASSTTKPKLAKHVTMAATTKEAKSLIGSEKLGDTRLETKRRKAAEEAKKALKEVGKPQGRKPKQQQKQAKKPTLKRLGTMAQTAAAGKEYLKRGGKKPTTTGRKKKGGGNKKSTKKN
ncbi:unnamed protein product [Didymodactylos carnosus]|uniref:Uncharacterized protein n=1 Tax=Didymodactylos carnosus TaxID=1234261 RepID=A0A8S2QP83_9BILA|nr:unnamed protein product [Didymodactylos carnosus]CAF4114510.1 unnamed protein product [Didymodactylos carnosus]